MTFKIGGCIHVLQTFLVRYKKMSCAEFEEFTTTCLHKSMMIKEEDKKKEI